MSRSVLSRPGGGPATGSRPARVSGATWRLPPAARSSVVRRTAIPLAHLPPPQLSGSAASNPRSVFNPLALAYLGDAVWEAHTRRLEVQIDAWSAAELQRTQQQQQQQQPPQEQRQHGEEAVGGRGGGGGELQVAGSRRGRGGGRAAAQQQQQQRGARGAGRGGSGGGDGYGEGWQAGGRSGGGAGGLASFSRQARKQWSTAEFQALVFDALLDGGLPLPPPEGPLALATGPPTPGFEPLTSAALPPPQVSEPGPLVPESNQPGNSPPPGSASATGSNQLAVGGPGPLVLGGGEVEAAATGGSTCPVPVPGLGTGPAPGLGTGLGTGPGGQRLVLSGEEADVLRWGRNAAVSSVPRDVPVGVYKKATAVEVLVAHMYLTNPDRCAALITAAVSAPLPGPPAPPPPPPP
ncbi:hypothetical protein PLESTB_001284800 [Pleodorina starrii]|uniref:RNase III domain-containing protein n=1 Tax=Pleodorina starrii TaxID=330485 RepID=A0A9W6BTV3_9CHLO|nr:hypothetical protein PLESTM_000830200 [Pleodorina starrii]GLC57880.1 hypothetical protein PLESTB_001284800 [Pleodorina starrii]GLC67127.1 hypothetical protein PLESTF_000518200 [Pleodorina starrii]